MIDKTHEFSEFESRAGVRFQDRALLQQAFTHRSFVNESRHAGEHNERLEFLGDAVLEIVVTDFLYRTYPHAPEGELTAYRAALVNATTLADVAERLNMNACLLLSKGESKDMGRARQGLLANAFEAVVGALYLDQGYDTASAFIAREVLARANEIVESGAWKDAKSAFQEIAQAKYGATPRYELISAEGPDHDKHFIVALMLHEREMARGEGSSKQTAEQDAAEKALTKEKN